MGVRYTLFFNALRYCTRLVFFIIFLLLLKVKSIGHLLGRRFELKSKVVAILFPGQRVFLPVIQGLSATEAVLILCKIFTDVIFDISLKEIHLEKISNAYKLQLRKNFNLLEISVDLKFVLLKFSAQRVSVKS